MVYGRGRVFRVDSGNRRWRCGGSNRGLRARLLALSEVGLVAVVFCFLVVLKLEDVDLEGLLMLAHVAEDDGAGFVEVWVCVETNIMLVDIT